MYLCRNDMVAGAGHLGHLLASLGGGSKMIVTVMYQLAAGQKFDLDYYLKTHMPLVEKLWGPSGLKSAKVLHGTGTPTGQPAVQHVIALLDFESLDAFKAAGRLHGKEVLGDIPNFTDAPAAIQFNETLPF